MTTNTRLVVQNVLGHLRSSTNMFHKGPTLFNAKPSEKLSKKLSSSVPILCTRNISDKPKPPSPMEEMKKSSRPYTIVVEGNIGSGKVCCTISIVDNLDLFLIRFLKTVNNTRILFLLSDYISTTIQRIRFNFKKSIVQFSRSYRRTS